MERTPPPTANSKNTQFKSVSNPVTTSASTSTSTVTQGKPVTSQPIKLNLVDNTMENNMDGPVFPLKQTGLDRYISVTKRRRSPQSAKVAHSAKKPNTTAKDSNRFALLADLDEPETPAKSTKPPPIYLREKNSTQLINLISNQIGSNNFYVANVKKGNIEETKIQINNEQNYRIIISKFELLKKNFYTYQLKTSKGLTVVIKGIEKSCNMDDIKEALEVAGFEVKNIHNIINRFKEPQPLFRVELQPDSKKLKRGEVHPIYNLRYLMHRRIYVEEPRKSNGPIQCTNCQEYGHTKTYCKLPSVCVICGDLHTTSVCNKPKNDSNVKKCSNCGENHTANYRGYVVYTEMRKKNNPRVIPPVPVTHYTPTTNNSCFTSGISYANVVRGEKAEQNSTVNSFNGTESILTTFMQTMMQFMNSMQGMLQELIKNQNALIQKFSIST